MYYHVCSQYQLFSYWQFIAEGGRTLNDELIIISEWFKTNLLSLNLAKTSYMIFGTRKYNDINLRMQNTPLTRPYKTKFLGIILSANLKWQKHIDVVLNKTSKSIGIISKVRHLLLPYLTRMLYMTLVEPYLNYCNLIWASGKKRNCWKGFWKYKNILPLGYLLTLLSSLSAIVLSTKYIKHL